MDAEAAVNIPLVDLAAQIAPIRLELDEAINRVISAAEFIGGVEHEAFEAEFAAFCDAGGCAACGNGTDALYLALRAHHIGKGDEVITVSNTFAATAEAITMAGARPVFADVLEDSLLMDPHRAEQAITERTKALVPVHLNGNVCDMDSILETPASMILS